MSPSKEQIGKLTKFNEQYKADDDSYYYNAIHVINPIKSLRYQILAAKPVLENSISVVKSRVFYDTQRRRKKMLEF